MKLVAVFTTTDSVEEARRIAAALVERRLAACVHVSPIESVYRWQGTTQHEPEYRLFIKTTADRYAKLEAAIVELHSYEIPAVYALDLDAVHGPYAEWVVASVRGDD